MLINVKQSNDRMSNWPTSQTDLVIYYDNFKNPGIIGCRHTTFGDIAVLEPQ